jgi:hypothetical protein
MPSLETAAQSLKVVPIIAPVHTDVEIETAITALGREPGGGLVVMPGQPAFVISAAARNNVPAVYSSSGFARDGGLLSYGGDTVDNSRRAATYVDRILRGEKPGALPVQFPTKFEMAVNLKTAKALGLAIPPSIMLRADEVTEWKTMRESRRAASPTHKTAIAQGFPAAHAPRTAMPRLISRSSASSSSIVIVVERPHARLENRRAPIAVDEPS